MQNQLKWQSFVYYARPLFGIVCVIEIERDCWLRVDMRVIEMFGCGVRARARYDARSFAELLGSVELLFIVLSIQIQIRLPMQMFAGMPISNWYVFLSLSTRMGFSKCVHIHCDIDTHVNGLPVQLLTRACVNGAACEISQIHTNRQRHWLWCKIVSIALFSLCLAFASFVRRQFLLLSSIDRLLPFSPSGNHCARACNWYMPWMGRTRNPLQLHSCMGNQIIVLLISLSSSVAEHLSRFHAFSMAFRVVCVHIPFCRASVICRPRTFCLVRNAWLPSFLAIVVSPVLHISMCWCMLNCVNWHVDCDQSKFGKQQTRKVDCFDRRCKTQTTRKYLSKCCLEGLIQQCCRSVPTESNGEL